MKMNAVTRNPEASLSDLDWQVVEMARQDGPRSLNPNGFWSHVADLFALPAARQLANEGLEALRRFSVRAWYWDLIRTSDMQTLIGAGYSRSDAHRILDHVAAHRGFTPSIQEDFL